MKFITNWFVIFVITISTTALQAKENVRVLIVLTSHAELGESGRPTGFWLPELTHPYYEFKEAGYTVDISSIKGGMAPIDPASFDDSDHHNNRFLNDPSLMSKVIRSIPLQEIIPSDYDAVIFSGGSGTMWDFPNNQYVNQITKEIYEQNGIVSAICHGPAALVDVKLSDGRYLITGKKIAAFTNDEEADIEQIDILPFFVRK